MNESRAAIVRELKVLFYEMFKIKDTEFSEKKSVNFDLGIDGDDGIELIEEIKTRFDTDISEFEFEEYFGPESSANPISLVFNLLLCKKRLKPLYIRSIVDAILRKKF